MSFLVQTPFVRWLPVALTALLWLPPATALEPRDATAGASTANHSTEQHFVRQGIAIDFQMEKLDPTTPGPFREGETAAFRFRITDTATGSPLSSVYPAAWMDLKPAGEETNSESCRSKVEAFIGGSLLTPPELDLNVYYVLALNQDATISVVDPLFGFGTTKLLDMIFLESPGEDWALSSNQTRLFVSLPDSDKVAVANLATWEVTAQLDVGPRPSRLALQPDGRYLWVGHDSARSEGGPSAVTVIDTEGPVVVREIPTGKGHHEIAFSDDSRWAFVTNEEDGTLSVIDIRALRRVRDIPVGEAPVSVAFSPIADAAYVVDRKQGTLVAVDGQTHQIAARITVEPGLGQLKFAPGGRLGFLVNPEAGLVHVLDASVHRILQTGKVGDGPDQVAFSDELVYVRRRDSEIVLMIPLDKVGNEGQPLPVVDFPGGQTPFGHVSRASLADSIVQAPGANAVLVANPADRAIYFYKEGMAAPMGHFQNYSREPRAVLAVDRSLRERVLGTYETSATLRRPGRYDVAFFLDSPRTVHCFEVEVASNPELEKERARAKSLEIEPLLETTELTVGEPTTLRFRLSDAVTHRPANGLRDVRVLTFHGGGREQRRHPAQQVGEGLYQIDFMASEPGVYYVFLECPSKRVRYHESISLVLRATAGEGNPRRPSSTDSSR